MRTLVKLHNASPFVNSYFDDFIRRDLHKGFLKSVPVNVKDLENELVLELIAPGFEKRDFVISIEAGLLKISANVKSEAADLEKAEKYLTKEFEKASFERKFKVGEDINLELVNAKYSNGILLVRLPKKDAKHNHEVRNVTID